MRLPFGIEIGGRDKGAAKLTVQGTEFAARSFVAAALPTRRPPTTSLAQRETPSAVTDSWVLALPDKLDPKQVNLILRGSLMGEIWRLSQLIEKMRESWPMFAKCSNEIRDAVSRVQYVVTPFAKEGEEPTPRNKDKADTVQRAMRSFKTDRFEDEDGFVGMVYDLMDAVLLGVSVEELQWHQVADPKGQMEWLPRAASWVHPKHYSVSYEGSLRVNSNGRYGYYDPLKISNKLTPSPVNSSSKYLVAKFKSKSGSFLGSGLARSLAWWYCAVVYGREFALSFAQKYGGPFLDIPYVSGISQDEVNKLENLAKRAANLGYCVHPNSGEIKVSPAQAMGGENPQVMLMKMADEACQILLLGQTATTQGTAGKMGEEQTRGQVRREYLESFAAWVSGILTDQFASSVIDETYGPDESERPTVAADFTEAEDPQAAATRWSTILNTRGLPVLYEEACAGLGIRQAEQGDKVLQDGRLGLLGDTDVDLDAPQDLGFGMDEFGQPIDPYAAGAPPMDETGGEGEGAEGEEDETGEGEGDEAFAADARGVQTLRRLLATATNEQLSVVKAKLELVTAARARGHLNGEAKELVTAVQQLKRSRQ